MFRRRLFSCGGNPCRGGNSLSKIIRIRAFRCSRLWQAVLIFKQYLYTWQIQPTLPSIYFTYIYKLPFNVCSQTIFKTFQYKILHRLLPCNYLVCKMKIKESVKCNFCGESDTISHYLIHCKNTKLYWTTFTRWWNNVYPNHPPLTLTDPNIIFRFHVNMLSTSASTSPS